MKKQILLFYKYIQIDNPKGIADWIRGLSKKYELKGRVIVASEGINATLAGSIENTEKFIQEFLGTEKYVNLFNDTHIKRSFENSDMEIFPKLSVKVRNEIVGVHYDEKIDPIKKTGKRLSVDQLRDWYKQKEDFIVVDMRNGYEYEVGHFENSVEFGLENSRDLPEKLEATENLEKLESLKNKKILTVCTGGVRCEKMSAVLLEKGFENVYQLDGGIHSYMEKYPGENFLGALYTFDQRVTMHFEGNREIIGKCHLCGDKSERYVNCMNPKCNLHFIACERCGPEQRSCLCVSCKNVL